MDAYSVMTFLKLGNLRGPITYVKFLTELHIFGFQSTLPSIYKTHKRP